MGKDANTTFIQCDQCLGLMPHRLNEEKNAYYCEICGHEKVRIAIGKVEDVVAVLVRHGRSEKRV